MAKTQSVAVSLEGGVRRAAVVVEATALDLPNFGKKPWSTKTNVKLDDTVDVRLVVKGGRDAKYKMTLTINDKPKVIEGIIEDGGVKYERRTYAAKTFGL